MPINALLYARKKKERKKYKDSVNKFDCCGNSLKSDKIW